MIVARKTTNVKGGEAMDKRDKLIDEIKAELEGMSLDGLNRIIGFAACINAAEAAAPNAA